MSIKLGLFGGRCNQWKGREPKERGMGENMIEVLYVHAGNWIMKAVKNWLKRRKKGNKKEQ
jgi:hypothetical protein